MMKTLIRCVKPFLLFSIFIGVYVLFDYFYTTSDFALKQNHWLLRTINHPDCSDTYILTDEDMTQRNQSWSVEYRFVDVILTLYDPNGSIKCAYASK